MADLVRTRRIGHVDNMQPGISKGYVRKAVGNRHAFGVTRTSPTADLVRAGRIGDIDDAQPGIVGGNVGVRAGASDAHGIAR